MNAAYVHKQLIIALRVARFEKDSILAFDQSIDGFFRSFIGIALCAPLFVLVLFTERRIVANAPIEMPEVPFPQLPPANLPFFLLESANYLTNWIIFPIAMIFLARLLGAGQRYVPFIIAFNWTSCVIFALSTIPSLLYLVGAVPISAAIALYYPVVLFAIVYHWKVAHEGLGISGLNAAGIVLFDLILSLFIALSDARLRTGLIEG